METNMNPEYVVLPSDAEEREATRHKKNYVQLRSSRVRIYTPEEIAEFSKGLIECQVSYKVWDKECRWNQLVMSKGSEPKW